MSDEPRVRVIEYIDPTEAYWWPPEARSLEEAGICPIVKMARAELQRRFPQA